MFSIETFKRYVLSVSVSNAIYYIKDVMGTHLYSSKFQKALEHYDQYFLRKVLGKNRESDEQAYLGLRLFNRVAYAILAIGHQPEPVQERFDREFSDLCVRYGVNMAEVEKLFEIDAKKDAYYKQRALEKLKNRQKEQLEAKTI